VGNVPDDATVKPKETELERGDIGPMAEPKRLVRADETRLPGDPPLDRIGLPDTKPLTASIAALTAAREVFARQVGRVD